MLIATISLVAISAVGVTLTLLKALHEHGKKSGELTSALNKNTEATNHLTDKVDKMSGRLDDHEIRIVKLESK